MTEFRRRVDPFELDLLEGLAGCMREHRLAKCHDSLLDTGNRSFEQDKVVFHLTVADEATKPVATLVSAHLDNSECTRTE